MQPVSQGAAAWAAADLNINGWEGAILMPARGNAPGTELDKKPSAESAIHTEFAHQGRVRRAFSAARLGYYKSWGVALGLSLSAAPLALN